MTYDSTEETKKHIFRVINLIDLVRDELGKSWGLMPPSLTELCGHPTPKGPCTMKKGHYAKYHRVREYEEVTWTIETSAGVTLETGKARVPMNYAITRAFEAGHAQIAIHLKRWNTEDTENDT